MRAIWKAIKLYYYATTTYAPVWRVRYPDGNVSIPMDQFTARTLATGIDGEAYIDFTIDIDYLCPKN